MADQIIIGNTSFNNLTFLATRTISLASSANFIVTGDFNSIGSTNSLVVLRATTSGQKSILRISGTQSVRFVNATDIDSTIGNTVLNVSGTITSTFNWTVPVPSLDSRSYIFFEG
jgi:hypothetical protein